MHANMRVELNRNRRLRAWASELPRWAWAFSALYSRPPPAKGPGRDPLLCKRAPRCSRSSFPWPPACRACWLGVAGLDFAEDDIPHPTRKEGGDNRNPCRCRHPASNVSYEVLGFGVGGRQGVVVCWGRGSFRSARGKHTKFN
jgi:hypothetical protein